VGDRARGSWGFAFAERVVGEGQGPYEVAYTTHQPKWVYWFVLGCGRQGRGVLGSITYSSLWREWCPKPGCVCVCDEVGAPCCLQEGESLLPLPHLEGFVGDMAIGSLDGPSSFCGWG
jgi:hypothetical protein